MIKILVFDSNIIFSKRVRSSIKGFIPDAKVDVAHNVPLLESRLKYRHYDLILADVLTAQEMDRAMNTLKKVRDSYVALWSPMNTDGPPSKPSMKCDLKNMIEPYLVHVAGAI